MTELTDDEIDEARYTLIGLIVVEANKLEWDLKRLPLLLADAKGMAGMALTANLNMSMLGEITLTAIKECGIADDLKLRGEAVVSKALEAYQRRNQVVHGHIIGGGREAVQFSVKARSGFKSHEVALTNDYLAGIVEDVIAAAAGLSAYIEELRPTAAQRV